MENHLGRKFGDGPPADSADDDPSPGTNIHVPSFMTSLYLQDLQLSLAKGPPSPLQTFPFRGFLMLRPQPPRDYSFQSLTSLNFSYGTLPSMELSRLLPQF